MYSYLKCIVYHKVLNPQQSFRITLYNCIFVLAFKLDVCHPRCVCENWKGCVIKHNYVN